MGPRPGGQAAARRLSRTSCTRSCSSRTRTPLKYKAVVEASRATHIAPLELLQKAGAIASPYLFHWKRFLLENFPKGTGFPAISRTRHCRRVAGGGRAGVSRLTIPRPPKLTTP